MPPSLSPNGSWPTGLGDQILAVFRNLFALASRLERGHQARAMRAAGDIYA